MWGWQDVCGGDGGDGGGCDGSDSGHGGDGGDGGDGVYDVDASLLTFQLPGKWTVNRAHCHHLQGQTQLVYLPG